MTGEYGVGRHATIGERGATESVAVWMDRAGAGERARGGVADLTSNLRHDSASVDEVSGGVVAGTGMFTHARIQGNFNIRHSLLSGIGLVEVIDQLQIYTIIIHDTAKQICFIIIIENFS